MHFIDLFKIGYWLNRLYGNYGEYFRTGKLCVYNLK